MKTERDIFDRLCSDLESGALRVAEKVDGEWQVNVSVKESILDGFRLGVLADMSQGQFAFYDKDTIPVRQFSAESGVRIVPGGTSIRRGACLAPGVIVMPPSYVNIGAYVDSGTMIDSHVLVGSCAQIGKNVHLSAGTQIGGVLEPVGAMPVIIEDGAFVGGNCGIYEGTVVRERAVIGTGVVINGSTPVYDAVKGDFLPRHDGGRIEIPSGAVVVAGSRPLRHGGPSGQAVHIYCPVIVKYRDDKTSASLTLEELLR